MFQKLDAFKQYLYVKNNLFIFPKFWKSYQLILMLFFKQLHFKV